MDIWKELTCKTGDNRKKEIAVQVKIMSHIMWSMWPIE